MLKVPTGFMSRVREASIDWSAEVTFGLYDITAKRDAAVETNTCQDFTDPKQTIDSVPYVYHIGTCEQNQFKTDGTFYLFPDVLDGIELGLWGEELSKADGTFSIPPIITYTFEKPHSNVGLTVSFAETVRDIGLRFYNGNTLLAEKEYTDLNERKCFLPLPVENYTKAVITVKRILPYHYMKLTEVDFGREYTYGSDKIVNFDVLETIDLKASNISSNSMSIELNNLDQFLNVFNPENEGRFLQQRQKLQIAVGTKINDTVERLPLGEFYLSDWKSTETTATLLAEDLISQLEGTYYASPFYVKERAAVILKNLFDSLNLYDDKGTPLYYIHPNVQDILLTGYLPPMEYRDALQRIALACRAVVKVDRYGILTVYRATEETRNMVIIDDYTQYMKSPPSGTVSAGQPMILTGDEQPIAKPITLDYGIISTPKVTLGKYYNQVQVEMFSWTPKKEREMVYEDEADGDVWITYKSYPASDIKITGVFTSAQIYSCACYLKGAHGKIKIDGIVSEAASKIVSAQLKEYASGTIPNTLDIKGITMIGDYDNAYDIAAWLLEQLQDRITQSFELWPNPAIEVSDYAKVETYRGDFKNSQLTKMHFKFENGGLSSDCEVVGNVD